MTVDLAGIVPEDRWHTDVTQRPKLSCTSFAVTSFVLKVQLLRQRVLQILSANAQNTSTKLIASHGCLALPSKSLDLTVGCITNQSPPISVLIIISCQSLYSSG